MLNIQSLVIVIQLKTKATLGSEFIGNGKYFIKIYMISNLENKKTEFLKQNVLRLLERKN